MGYNPFEVNQAAKKAAKLLGESGQVGRVEGKKYEVRIEPWRDGELFDFSTAEFYKVSDLTPTLAELDGATLEVQFEGEVMETTISADQFMKCNRDELYVHPDIGVCLATEDFENYDGAHVTAGLYMMYDVLDEGSAYVLIWGNETIHPIDPKFIPGAVLPVVEISTAPGNLGVGVQLSEAETAAVAEALANYDFAIITIDLYGIPGCAIGRKVDMDGLLFFAWLYPYAISVYIENGVGMVYIEQPA